MKIIKLLTNLFKKRELTPDEMAEKVIRKMGFKKEREGTFVRESYNGRTMIWLMNDGILIKVYSGDYGESDFLKGPVTDPEKIKNFISNNAL